MKTSKKIDSSIVQNLMRLIKGCLCGLVIVNLTMPVFAIAREIPTVSATENNVSGVNGSDAQNIATGVLGTCNWRISSDGILTIDSGNLPNVLNSSPWEQYSHLIKEVRLSGTINAGNYLNHLFDGLSNVTTIQNLNFLNTSNTTRMMYVFRNCSSLKSVDLSTWDTSKVITFTAMFNGCRSISELDLSTFDTSSATSYYMMFNNCPALKTLNIRGFGKNGTTSAYNMFDASNASLSSITVGNYTPFKSDSSGLPEHAEAGAITKGWIGMNSKKHFSTTREFTTTYDGSTPDTYVWALYLLVDYQDQLEKPIHEANKLFGYLGEPYDTNSSDLKLDIPGYQLDTNKLPKNAVGTFGNDLQTVTYKYVKDSDKAKDLTINYQDTEGKKIADSKTITGEIGKPYDVTTDEYKPAIEGYTFKEIQGTPVGTLSDVEQTVTFVYTQDQPLAKAKNLTINYQDTEGKKIADPKIISGYINDPYDVTTDEYKPAIEGYTFKEIQGTPVGTLSDKEQTVTFVYTKEEPSIKAKDLTIQYRDTEGKEIAESKTISGSVGELYDVTTDEYKPAIEGYTFKEIQGTPVGILSDEEQTVTFVYTKDEPSIKAKDVTINYQDTEGEKLAESRILSGEIGKTYDVSTNEYELTIEGYTFKEIQGNPKGAFSETAQTVTFVYTKKVVKQVDKQKNQTSSHGKNISVSLEKRRLPRTGETTNQWEIYLGLGITLLIIFILGFKKKAEK